MSSLRGAERPVADRTGGVRLDGLDREALLTLAAEVVGRLDTAGRCALVEEALRGVGAEVLGGAVPDEALRSSVTRLQRIERVAAAERLRRIGEIDARGAAGGARSTADLLATAYGLTRGEARTEADTARALSRLPRTAAKLASGEISVAQAAVAARRLAEVTGDPDVAGDADATAQRVAALDERVAATAPSANRAELSRDLDTWAHQADSQALTVRERRAHARRHLRVWDERDGGVAFAGRGGPLLGAKLRTVVGALSRRTGVDDPRDAEQRRLDALEAALDIALDGSRLPQVAAQRPHVILVTTPGTLHDAAGAAPAHLDGYGPVSGELARQVCCDAEVTRVATQRNGAVLDVGRASREPNREQRVAIAARDRGCVAVGCTEPIARTQVHHINWWDEDGGGTDLDNLVAVCAHHHHCIHHFGWIVVRHPGGRYRVVPPGHPHHPGPSFSGRSVMVDVDATQDCHLRDQRATTHPPASRSDRPKQPPLAPANPSDSHPPDQRAPPRAA